VGVTQSTAAVEGPEWSRFENRFRYLIAEA